MVTKENDRQKPQMDRYILMRRISDFGMGTLYVAIGVVVLFAKQFNFKSEFTLSIPAKLFGVIAVIYGGWRIYRGIKKQYFKP